MPDLAGYRIQTPRLGALCLEVHASLAAWEPSLPGRLWLCALGAWLSPEHANDQASWTVVTVDSSRTGTRRQEGGKVIGVTDGPAVTLQTVTGASKELLVGELKAGRTSASPPLPALNLVVKKNQIRTALKPDQINVPNRLKQ